MGDNKPTVGNTSITNTTVGNTARVGAYSGVAGAAVYVADKRFELQLDNIETWLAVTVVSAVAAFIWNRLKDRDILKDNR